MTSRALMEKALLIAKEGMPTRARVNKFGENRRFRQKVRLWVWAMRVLERGPCQAKRRRDGKPCRALNEPGKTRCRWHGGCSTGPRTSAGKAASLKNLRQHGCPAQLASIVPAGLVASS
jgi:hypothetical protein